jgi:hypothetical protein
LITGIAESYSKAIAALRVQHADIVLWILTWAAILVFNILDELLCYQAAVVMAYEEFALKAFKYAVVNYLFHNLTGQEADVVRETVSG